MLFLSSNARNSHGFTELASLAKYFPITLVVEHSLMIECFACLWMLFLFSNAKNYPGFTELASLAKIYFQSHLSLGVTLILKCFISLGILFLFSNAGNSPGFTELASLATYFPITPVIGYFSDDRMLCLSLDALLVFQC